MKCSWIGENELLDHLVLFSKYSVELRVLSGYWLLPNVITIVGLSGSSENVNLSAENGYIWMTWSSETMCCPYRISFERA